MANYAPVQETLAPAAGPPIDPDVLEQRRKLAQALIAQAMGGQPIGHWSQGIANLAQALMGGYAVRKTNQQEAAGRASGAGDTAAVLAEIAAMGGGTADLPGTEAVSAPPGADLENFLAGGARGNAGYVYNGMLKRGASPAGAASFAASMQQESGFNPSAHNPGEGAIGGIQWRGPRAAGLKAFAAAQGKKWNADLDVQMDYAVHEMKTSEAGAGQAFFAARTPEEANRALKQYIRYGDKAGPAGSAGWDFRKRLGNTRRILDMQGGGGGETAALPNVDPVSTAPSPDVAQFLGMTDAQQPPATPQDLMRDIPNTTAPMLDELRRVPQRKYAPEWPAGTEPADLMRPLSGDPAAGQQLAMLEGGMRANPRVVYPPPEQPPAPVPNVGMGELTGSGTRAGPDYVPAPAPIGRGATAAPVAGTPMPTRPTVTGYPAIAAALQAPPANYDPITMPRPVPPPDAMGRTTPGTSGPYAMPQPVPQGGHVLMAQQPPAPLPRADQGLALLDPSAVPFSVDAPTSLAPVAVPPQSPRDRAVQAVVQAQGRADAPILASMDVPALPRPRPAGPLPSMPPGQPLVAPAQSPEHPLARAPQPRPVTPTDPAAAAVAAPATTGAIAPPPRRQIFREPYPGAPLSAQEFARQGQNYLTGRGSFANQTARVAPRTMQEPIAGAPRGAPAAAAPAQPRRGLLAALLGRGGPQAPAGAQAAPAGSPVAAGGAAAPAGGFSPRVSAFLANPYVDPAIKTAVLARLMPKDREGFTLGAGEKRYDAKGNLIATGADKPEDSFRPMTAAEKASYGIPADDPKPYEINTRTNEIKAVGSAPLVQVGGPETGAAKLRSKLGEKEGERLSALKEAGTTAAGTRQDLEALGGLIKMAPQGPIVGPLAQAFPGFSNAGAAFQSIVKRVAPTLRAVGSGATSDIEYQGMLDSMPALSNRPEANAAIAGMMTAKAEINIKRSDVIDKFESGEITDTEMRSQLRTINQQSIMTPELKQLFAGIEPTTERQPRAGDIITNPQTNERLKWDGSKWVPA